MTEQEIIDRLRGLGYDGPDEWGQMTREDAEGNLSRITLNGEGTITMSEWSAGSRAWRGDGTTYTLGQFEGVLTDLEHAMEEDE